MPKFNFKDAVKSAGRKRSEESRPLATSVSNYSMYSQSTNGDFNDRKISTTSQLSLPKSPSSSSSLPKALNEYNDTPMIKIRPGSLPASPNSANIRAVMDIDFDSVPFQFYSRESDNWKESFVQGIVIGMICILCPAVLMVCIFAANHSYTTKYKQNAKEEETKREFWVYMILLAITLTKDLIIIALVLQFVFDTDASSYIVGYSPIVFFWFLILFAFPLTVFYFADARYEFGFDSDRKKLLKTFSFFTSPKAKRQQVQKVSDQDKYFIEHYEQLSSIQTSNDEFMFMWRLTSQHMVIATAVLSVIICIFHAFVPMLLQLMYVQNTVPVLQTANSTNTTNHTTTTNELYVTRDNTQMYIVIGFSTINSFIVSLLASPYFVYVILWKLAMLHEWKRFNETEKDTNTTLVAAGPQGIAMWWKIRQTLKLFSGSSKCLSVLIGKMASVVSMILITGLSVVTCLRAYDLNSGLKSHLLIPLLIDNGLLYVASVVIGTLTIMISQQKTASVWIIELKQLNLSYELGQLMNLEQEIVDNEPGVKVKVRVMRGCLMLLQELTSTMENLERNTSTSKMTIASFAVSTLVFVPSMMLGFRYISSVSG